jgi:aspartate-semialdehyde dehydrogenase
VNVPSPRIGVVGATGAVGTITLELLAERGYDVRAFASARSVGARLPFGDDEILVEEATPEALGAGDVDLFLFSVGTGASKALVPVAAGAGAICVDKSSAYRLVDGYPLVVPEVNGARAVEALERDRIVANPNCCTIPLTCVLKPLHDAAGLKCVHVATYQSVSGAGAQRMETLRAEPAVAHNLVMDWTWEGDESDEESKLRAETRKILELPDLAISATCVRVPVLVGHSEAIWAEFEEPLSPREATAILSEAPSVRVLRLPDYPTPADAAGGDEVLVGRIRRDEAATNGLALFLANDNLRKGAALNAIQIAELLLGATAEQKL